MSTPDWAVLRSELSWIGTGDDAAELRVPVDVLRDVGTGGFHHEARIPNVTKGEVSQLCRIAIPAVRRIHLGVWQLHHVALTDIFDDPDSRSVEVHLVAILIFVLHHLRL